MSESKLILRKTDVGVFAYPISEENAAKALENGEAELLPDGVLREIEKSPLEYATKDMAAAPKRRGRPPKDQSAASGDQSEDDASED